MAARRCCSTSTSRCARARSSRCSAATAPANRPRSRRSWGWCRLRPGEVRFDGQRPRASCEPYEIARLGLGYVPEDRRIFTDLTVAENLEVGRQPPRAGARRPGARKGCSQLFPALGRAARAPRRRACRAASSRCCASRARSPATRRAILLDEPSEGLAPVVVEQVAARHRASSSAPASRVLLAEQSRHFTEPRRRPHLRCSKRASSASMSRDMNLERFAWLSVAAALATIALKTLAWWLTGSVGLLSDALESIVNLAAALLALPMLRLAAVAARRRASLRLLQGGILRRRHRRRADRARRRRHPGHRDPAAAAARAARGAGARAWRISAAASLINLGAAIVLLRVGQAPRQHHARGRRPAPDDRRLDLRRRDHRRRRWCSSPAGCGSIRWSRSPWRRTSSGPVSAWCGARRPGCSTRRSRRTTGDAIQKLFDEYAEARRDLPRLSHAARGGAALRLVPPAGARPLERVARAPPVGRDRGAHPLAVPNAARVHAHRADLRPRLLRGPGPRPVARLVARAG